MPPSFYRFLADVVVAVHFSYVAFVLVGMAAILVGLLRRWAWVRNFWFRVAHLLAIGVVVLESVCGVTCPLTTWENELRAAAGIPNAPGSFIGRVLHDCLFFELPQSDITFTISYSFFGLAVFCVWIVAPPRWPWKRRKGYAVNGPE
jgi:hypothetical protein